MSQSCGRAKCPLSGKCFKFDAAAPEATSPWRYVETWSPPWSKWLDIVIEAARMSLFDELRVLAGKGARLLEKSMDMKAYYATAAAIVAFWKANGLTLEQACGILAQADAESSLKVDAIGDHGVAYGIHQWHPMRRDAIKAGCGIDLGELPPLAAQLQAALWELTHTEQRAFHEIKKAQTAWAAGVAACRYWERPGSQAQWNKRGKKAGEWFKYFSQKPAAPAAKVA